MPIPTIFNHYLVDKHQTSKRYKTDVILTLLALCILGGYGIITILELLTKTTYEGICSNEGLTAKILCDEWSFRQCSYFGDQVGAKANNVNNALSREDCEISAGGGCPVYDITSRNFCTNYKGGNMEGDGQLWSYLWTQQMNQETVQFNGIAQVSSYMCCGQIQQTVSQKLIIW
eukprot:345872_1